jgi:glucoamylase
VRLAHPLYLSNPARVTWAVSTANFAELYYRLAGQVATAGTVPLYSLSAGFFSQVGADVLTTQAAAAAALQAAGDQMLQAVIFHSDNLELSEQSDAATGYETTSATCPGARPHSCPRSALGPPSEMNSSATHCATFSG